MALWYSVKSFSPLFIVFDISLLGLLSPIFDFLIVNISNSHLRDLNWRRKLPLAIFIEDEQVIDAEVFFFLEFFFNRHGVVGIAGLIVVIVVIRVIIIVVLGHGCGNEKSGSESEL